MKDKFRELPSMDEIKRYINDEVRHITKKEKDLECCKKNEKKWCLIGIGVIVALIGVIIWIAKKRDKDLEEHYEYFDDLDDDDYDEFEDFESDDDDDDSIEYVKINDFMPEEDVEEVKIEEVKVEDEKKDDSKKSTKKSKNNKKDDEK